MKRFLISQTAMLGCLACRLSAQTIAPNDPQFPFQWNLGRIGATNVWATTTGSTNVVVAVIDTGVDYTHADLANMWRNPGENGLDASGHDKATNGIDDDSNGYVDDVYGVDVHDQDGDPREEPYFDGTALRYHGSNCAGIIGAVANNAIGTAGINWNVSIMAIRGFPYVPKDTYTEADYVSGMIAAFEYVLEMKRRKINIVATSGSYANASYNQTLKDLIDAAGDEGILNVFAAGNNGMNNDEIGLYPCGYNSPSIISVANSMRDDVLAPDSCYGGSTVHLTAPGREIRTVFSTDFDGTSAACPHVAGAVALLKAALPTASAAEIKAAILGSVDQPAGLRKKVVSNGRLNVGKALARLTNATATAIVLSAHPAGPRARFNPVITVTFSRRMNSASVESAFQLSPAAPGRFEWTNENRTLSFFPDEPLSRTMYTAKILGSAQDASGGSLDGNFNSSRQGSPADDFMWTFSFGVPNDDFADAQIISGESGSITGTTRNAWPEMAEPNHVGHPFSRPSVWYRWTPSNTGWFTFDTRQATSFDNLVAVYTGTDLGELKSLAGNDNYGTGIYSRVSFLAIAGETYSVAVAGKSTDQNKAWIDNSSFGTFKLSWYPTPSPGFTSIQFSPATGVPGAKVTFTGTNFTGATSVLFNGASASFTNAPTNNFDLRITAVVPPDATSGPITIVTPHGKVTSTASFQVLPPPLAISLGATNGVVIRWPAKGSAFVLEATDDLAAGSWSVVEGLIVDLGEETRIGVPAPKGVRFFRLRSR